MAVKRPPAPECETPPVKIVVVGHVEWVEFARVEHVPQAGEIVHAAETWEEAAGGGAVAAVQLVNLGVETTLHAARRAPLLVATAREIETLREGAVELDALVGSGEDPRERYGPGDLEPRPRLVVTTAGALGGWMNPGGPYLAAPLPGPVEDAYGCGDCFAAGLTFGLADGRAPEEAVELATRCGAAVLTGRGAYAGQLTLA